jgi:tape measure domain-containing protein
MPESSVKITLGVQLDKSDIDKQLQEMQKELDAYKLKIGVDREQLTQDTESKQSSDKSSPKSFESPENEENIDFGVLSDLANEKFNQTFGLIDVVNDNLIEILGEVKAIRGALDGLSPASKTQEGEQVSSAPINSTLDTVVKESGEKITNQLTDIVAVLSTISDQLSEKKEPLTPANLSGETTISETKAIAGTNQSVSENSTDIVPLVQDAIDKISTNINQSIESLSNQFSGIQEITDIANNSFTELVSTTKAIIESVSIDITKIIANSLDEILTEIQDSVIELLETTLANLTKQILDNILNNSQKNTGEKDGGDNNGSTISSGISSLISVIVRLQEVLTTQLGQITGQLFPEVIAQLQFDFFKSLIGGAVEKLGAVLINQSAGGAAKLAEGVITGNVFRQSDPASAATMAFGEGFAANDPALLGSALSQISKKLDVLNPAIAEPSTQAQLDSAPEVETIRMTAVLEAIAGNISASNIILDKIVGAIEAGDQDITEQRRLGGSSQQRQLEGGLAEPIKMIAVLEYVADKIETTNQILEEIQAEVSLISFDDERQTVSRQGSDNLLPSASDYTDVSFEDIIAQIVPSTPIEIPEIEPDKLVSNFTRIIEDVFNEIGISVQQIAKAGKLPQLDIDTDENLPRGSKYNRKANKISVSESIAKDLSSGNNISKDSFIPIVRELRKAIQSGFTDKDYRAKQNKAMRDKGFMVEGVKIPRLIQDNLIDKSQPKLSQVKNNIGDAVKEETNNKMSVTAVKGFTSANTDAEVFAQNLADKLFSTPIDIPEIDQLFRASGGGDKGNESNDKVESLLTDLIQSSDESNVLLREGIQGDRTNIERLSGDKFVNESSSQLGGDPASSKIEGIVNEIKGFGASFNKDFSNIFDTRLKDFAINASKAVGVPDTGWVDNVTNFVQYLDVFANLLKVINPELADSFRNIGKTAVNDSVRFASQGMKGIASRGTEFYNQVRSNPNLQRDAIANRINQGRDFINAAKNRIIEAIPPGLIDQGRNAVGAAKNRIIEAIPPGLIDQGRNAVGAAKNRIIDAIPPELISQLQALQQQVSDSGAIDSLRSVLEKVNNLGGQLLASIGQLINAMGGAINNGESVPAVKDFVGNVQAEINARTNPSNNESLFRADMLPDLWDDELTQASPEFAFDEQNVISISPLNTIGDSSMALPDPWAELEKPSKASEQRLSGEDNKGQDKVQVDLATFIQKALPIAVAGLVVAKLGTSLLNNVLPGKSNIERKVSVDSLQSTLTKALIGAVTVAIGQKLAPQLSKVFTTDKNVTLSDRVKSLFSNPANVPPQSEPSPYANLSDEDLAKLFRSPIPGEKPSLGNNPIVDKAKESFASGNISESLKSNGINLLKLLGGSAVGVLSENLMKFPGGARSSKETQESFPEKVFKRAFEEVASNLATNAIKSTFKLNSNKDNQESFMGKMFKGLLERFAINFSKSVIKSSIQGDTRQKPLEEKIFRGLFGSLTNQTRAKGRQIDERFASYTGKKRDVGDISGGGMFESLFSKLPVLLTGLIIGRLIADVVPKIVDGFKQSSSGLGIDSVDLSQKSSLFGREKNKTDIKEVINPSQDAVNLESATKLAQQITRDSGLTKEQQTQAEQDYIDLYLSNPQAFAEASAKNSGNTSATTEMEQLDKNFKAIADEVFRVSGLNPSKISQAGLFPQVSVDSENKLKGASAYSIKDNQVTLSSDIAKMLSSSEGISKEAFTTIAHELRHAMQLSFGKNNINAVAAIAQDNSSLPIGKNAKIDLKTERNLVDPSKAEQISKQVDASLAMTQPGALSKGIEALEVDAEVFAQNLADVFYGLNEKVPDILPRANVANSDKSLDSRTAVKEKTISSLDKGIKDLGKTYKTISSQATNPNLANLVTIDIPDIITKETPELLDTSLPNLSTEPLVSPDTSFPLPTIDSNNQQDDSVLFADSGMGDKAQTILQAIKVSVERITVLLDNIAAQLGAAVSPELNLGAESMSTIDSLYRGVTEDNKKTKKEQGGEKEKTRAVIIGEKIGTKLENAIDNMQSRLNKKMQDAGMSEDDIRGLADQAGGYMFANLSAFFPAGAIGVALAPVIASVSALGIPIAAAVNQLAPIGQMLADTMRTMTPIQTRFETIGGDPESGQQMLDFAAQVAQEYNTPLLASIEGFSRLAAASKGSKLEGQDTEELFKGVSQAMAALGLNAQDASLIFLAFQQVISKGKVAAEELRGQIGERLPGAIQLAAKSMGMTVADFSAALDRGEISSNILLPKLAKAFQEEYGAGAKAASKGFLGTLNKIENSLFNFRRLMTDEFGGIVAGIANAAATALDAVLWLMDNVLLKSGLMFNAILGIQAQIIAGTAFIFSKLDLPLALAKALSGGYGKMSLVLIPFVFGLFQEIIGTVLAKILGVEIDNAVEILTGFFSTLVGRVIQTVIDLSKDPKQVMEGIINIVRSISIGVKSAAESFLNLGIAIRSSIGVGIDELTWFVKKLGEAERLINKVADNSISRIYAPQAAIPQATNAESSNDNGFASMFNGKAIARLSLEFFSLFAIMIQTMVLLRIIGEQVFKAGEAFKVFGGKFKDALISMKTGKSILSMLTLGFSGLNLLLAALATLVVLMAFKSSSTNSFLSQLSNSVKALEGLNKNLDNLTNKKIEITTEIIQLDQAGVRDTPFQDKGLTLTPWRAKDQEQFTTDDVIRMIQKRIDSTAYRRDLPLLPDNFSESRGSLFDQGNLSGLGNVLTSQVGQQNQPTSFDELISLKDKLAEERKSLEDYLTLYLQLDTTNTFDELTRLKNELGDVDSQLADVQQKREKLGKRSSVGQVVNQMTNAFRGEENLPGLNESLVETVKLFRDIAKYTPGLGTGASGVSASPRLVTNLLIGAESLDYTETELRLNQRRAELQSQINSFEQQRALNPGSDTMIGLTPLEAQIETLKKELKTVDNKIEVANLQDNISIPVPGFGFQELVKTAPTPQYAAIQDFSRLTERDELLRRRESIAKSIEELQKTIGASVDDLEKEIQKRSRRIQELNIPSVADGKTVNEEKAQEVQRLEAEITALSAQKESAKAAPVREELARINQDLRAIQTFATTPGVFNNAFNQDDTVLREMVSQQLDVFSVVQNEQINPQRLDEGNLISVLPELQRDVQKERDLTANRIQEIEEEIAQLDTTGEGAKDRLVALNKELKSFNNRLIGLKGLNRFLDISQSYADLGAGKQELQNTRIARSLTRLSQALKDNPVQSEALQQFQQSPTLPNLAQLEQSILIDLVPAQQAVTRAKSERENIATTPMLRTEQDLRSAGYVTKEQKQQLDVFRALEESVQREIQSARKTVAEAYSDYNQATAEGLDFQPALDNYYAVEEQLKELQTQLQELRAERDAFLDEIKTVAPPIQVDDTAREQRLAEVDQAIKEAESRVNELAKQYQLIQETKSGLGGLGQLGENLDVAAAKLREPLRGFAAILEFATRRREGAAKIMEQRSDNLNPALETVGGFINQQQNLSGGARSGLVGALNSGDYAMTKTALESITIQDGKLFFNGEELTGTNEEIANFTKALKTATRILGFIGNDSTKGSRPVQQAIEEAFGIKTVDTQRAEISNQYFSQIASLATSGIFSESQLMGLTQDGLKLTDAQKILDEVKNRDGLTNFQSVIETLQDQDATPGEIRDVQDTLTKLEQTFVDALALDPRGATRVRLGTVGEEEYTQTVGKLDQIQDLAAKSSEKLGLQYYDGNINTWMTALKDVKPGFLENIQQLRTIEEELTRLGQKRIEINEQLTRTDLSKDQRKNLTAQATQLDEDFKIKYREKKVAGADLTEAFTFYQAAEKELSLLAEEIEKSDLSQQIKDSLLAMIKQTEKNISPGLEALQQFEDLMSLSGEEALEAAGKSITRALENFEKITKQIDFVTQQKLADITTALLEFSSNKALAITDLNKSVAGLAGDPEKLAAEQDLAIAQVNAQQSLEKLTAAQKTKEDVDRNVEISLQKAAFSPIEALAALELAQEKQIEALNAFSQAQEEYSQNIKALTEAQLAKIEADTQIPVRISQFNSKQKNINYKQQRLDGVLKESDVTRLQLQDEIGLLDIEIASTASELEAIAKGIKDGYITNIDDANQKISDLVDKQQDLISNRLDKLLEQENEERERSIKLLEDQSSLSAKYFDVAINGYELLNKETERYTKQLDNLTQIGEQLKTLSQAQFQVDIGKGETGSSLIDAGAAAREQFLSEDISPRQRAFQASRLGALQQLGQGYGIQPAAFGMNEDAALAEQQKIATKLAREKLDAMEKEQAIAAKLLEIEIQRNQIVAQMAVREAEIGKLRAEQALIQAQFGLQQAILGKDPTAIKLAELELQIAASQQGLADAELGSAQENLALQALFAEMQKEAAKLDAESGRDGLIAEIAGNENVDLASILQSLQNFQNFDPTKANPREVFAPYLDWLNKQTPQRDDNTPLAFPDIAGFDGDFQAWAEANLSASAEERRQLEAQTPPEVQSLKNVFDKIFGEPVATKIDMSNGKVQDISKEIAILNAGRLGEKVAPTQEMIDSVSGQREIDNALEQARRLAQASEPVDNSRMASDVYSISTDMADAMSTFLTIAELLGLIALNTRGGGEATGGNNPSGGGESTPPGIEDGGNAYEEVQQLLEQLKNARGIKDVLEPIVNETKTETPWAAPLSGILEGSSGQPQSNPLDLSESIMPTPVNPVVPIDQQSALPPSSDTRVSAILNPTIQNSVTPRFAAPAVNVSTVARREPGYFYRNLANEVTPQVAYRVPPGVQATQGATSYQPSTQNTTINITNKIDAASQREMYAKIGETQTKAVLSALNKMA